VNNETEVTRDDIRLPVREEYPEMHEAPSSEMREPPTGSELIREIRAGFEILRAMNGHGKSPDWIAWEKRFDSLAVRIANCE